MRISILSNSPWSATGYGVQTKLVSTRLRDLGHAVAVQAFHGHAGSPINWNGIQIYGVVAHPFGQDIMHANAMNFKSDVLISNMDIWVVEPNLMFDTKWVAWMPIDHDPIPPKVLENAKSAWHRIVWTNFAKKLMDAAGLDYDYIPYGLETDVYKPIDRVQARTTAGFPLDKYVVGMVAMNKGFPPRKAFYQNIEAFKKFHDKHPDSMLYLHTADGTRNNGEQINLASYCKFLGLEHGKDVLFADQYSYALGYPDEAMVTLYNCFDVHLLVSTGEGFGMPQLEAQSCGTPVICGDWTAMPELCFAGWKVDKSDATATYDLQESYQFVPRVDAIVDKLEMAYQMRGNPDYAKRARDGALKYDINKVVEKYWVPALERMDAKLKGVTVSDQLSTNLNLLRVAA